MKYAFSNSRVTIPYRCIYIRSITFSRVLINKKNKKKVTIKRRKKERKLNNGDSAGRRVCAVAGLWPWTRSSPVVRMRATRFDHPTFADPFHDLSTPLPSALYVGKPLFTFTSLPLSRPLNDPHAIEFRCLENFFFLPRRLRRRLSWRQPVDDDDKDDDDDVSCVHARRKGWSEKFFGKRALYDKSEESKRLDRKRARTCATAGVY